MDCNQDVSVIQMFTTWQTLAPILIHTLPGLAVCACTWSTYYPRQQVIWQTLLADWNKCRINSRWYHWEKMEHNVEHAPCLATTGRHDQDREHILGMWWNSEAERIPDNVHGLSRWFSVCILFTLTNRRHVSLHLILPLATFLRGSEKHGRSPLCLTEAYTREVTTIKDERQSMLLSDKKKMTAADLVQGRNQKLQNVFLTHSTQGEKYSHLNINFYTAPSRQVTNVTDQRLW